MLKYSERSKPMEFVASFIEIICMLILLGVIFWAVMYLTRHRARWQRWIENYSSKDNVAEREERIRFLKRKIEDAEAEIDELDTAAKDS